MAEIDAGTSFDAGLNEQRQRSEDGFITAAQALVFAAGLVGSAAIKPLDAVWRVLAMIDEERARATWERCEGRR